MRHRRQSGGRETRTRRWSAVLIVAVAVLVGTTWIAAQEPAAQPAQRPATRPLREPPGLLSAPEVVKGLTARHRNLRDRFLAHEQRRSQDSPEDYAMPERPPSAHVPPRPDAPGGEFDAGGVR